MQAASPAPAAPSTAFTFEQSATVTGFNTSTQLNPEELATADTAAKIAKMLGGTVDTQSEPADSGFSWSAPTREISFTDSTVKINAGIAHLSLQHLRDGARQRRVAIDR